MSEWNWKQASLDFALRTLGYVAVVACVGLLSVAIVFSVFLAKVGDAAEPEVVLGVMDRAQAMHEKSHERELELILAERSRLDAELLNLSGSGALEYCMTSDYERIYLDEVRKQHDFWLD